MSDVYLCGIIGLRSCYRFKITISVTSFAVGGELDRASAGGCARSHGLMDDRPEDEVEGSI